MTGIRKIFIFSFSGWETPGEPELDKRGFVITFKDKEEIAKFYNWTIDDVGGTWYDFLGDMEGYGVHDFSTTGYGEIVGYHTYEIRLDKRDEVMNKWREWISNHGYECGTILTNLTDDDWKYPDLNLDHEVKY